MTTSPYRSIPALRQMAAAFRARADEHQKTTDATVRQLNLAAAHLRRMNPAADMRAVMRRQMADAVDLRTALRQMAAVAAVRPPLQKTAGASLPPHLRSPALRPPIPPVAATLRRFPPVEPLR